VADAQEWLAGTRPRTLPAAVVPVLIGSGVAFGYGKFSWWRALLALVVALALQVGVNFANDYSDGVRGSDEQRVGPVRLVAAGLAAPRKVLAAVTEAPPREVVGFASAGPATDADRWPGTDGQVYELRVIPERTGQGHGSRLLHAAADMLVSDGFHTLVIWALEADTALRRFLESSGWAADGARGELDVGTSVPVVRLHTAISE